MRFQISIVSYRFLENSDVAMLFNNLCISVLFVY